MKVENFETTFWRKKTRKQVLFFIVKTTDIIHKKKVHRLPNHAAGKAFNQETLQRLV
jgi:hypothetical protein